MINIQLIINLLLFNFMINVFSCKIPFTRVVKCSASGQAATAVISLDSQLHKN